MSETNICGEATVLLQLSTALSEKDRAEVSKFIQRLLEAEARIAELEKREQVTGFLEYKIRELTVDKELLDWLDRHGESYGFEDTIEGNEWKVDGAFRSVRDAIRAARAAEKEGK